MQNAPMMPQPKKGMATWLIVLLIVVGLAVVLFGVMGVLAIFGVRKYIAASKSAEALNGVGSIARSAVALYDDGSKTPLCESASSAVPRTIASVSAKKYQSTPSDWEVDAASNAGFSCLRFSMSTPQYFQYDYRRTGDGLTPGDQLDAIAHGDLNGNGFASTYDVQGTIEPSGSVHVETQPKVTNEGE